MSNSIENSNTLNVHNQGKKISKLNINDLGTKYSIIRSISNYIENVIIKNNQSILSESFSKNKYLKYLICCGKFSNYNIDGEDDFYDLRYFMHKKNVDKFNNFNASNNIQVEINEKHKDHIIDNFINLGVSDYFVQRNDVDSHCLKIFELIYNKNNKKHVINFIHTRVIDFNSRSYESSEFIVISEKDDKIISEIGKEIIKTENNINSQKPILQNNMLDDIVSNSIGFIKNQSTLNKFGVYGNRGIIFYGPPGHGKTLTCNWIKKLCIDEKIKFQIISNSHLKDAISQGFSGEIFNFQGISFFDDIDISVFNRKGDHANPGYACSLLACMDGIAKNSGSVRIFTTNEEIKNIDPAFTRPGRIDKVYKFDFPNKKCIQEHIKSWNKEITSNIDIKTLVEYCDDRTLAEVNSIKEILVYNFIENKKWDLEKSIEIFEKTSMKGSSYSGSNNKPLGFAAAALL